MPTIVQECILIRDNDNDYDDADNIHKPWDHFLLKLHHLDCEEHDDNDNDDLLPCASIHSKNIMVDIKILIPPLSLYSIYNQRELHYV